MCSSDLHGITNRVQQHIGIRVTIQPLRVLDLHAPKPKRSPLNKAMHIVTYSGMNHGRIIVSYLGWPRANIAMPAATEALSECVRINSSAVEAPRTATWAMAGRLCA